MSGIVEPRRHSRRVNAPTACTFLCIFARERLRTPQIGNIEHMLHPVYPWSILRVAFSYRFPTRERSQVGARAGYREAEDVP
jgi:hypothetical protein